MVIMATWLCIDQLIAPLHLLRQRHSSLSVTQSVCILPQLIYNNTLFYLLVLPIGDIE